MCVQYKVSSVWPRIAEAATRVSNLRVVERICLAKLWTQSSPAAIWFTCWSQPASLLAISALVLMSLARMESKRAAESGRAIPAIEFLAPVRTFIFKEVLTILLHTWDSSQAEVKQWSWAPYFSESSVHFWLNRVYGSKRSECRMKAGDIWIARAKMAKKRLKSGQQEASHREEPGATATEGLG